MSFSSCGGALDLALDPRAVGAGDAQRRGDVLVDRHRRVVDELLVDHGDVALLHRHAGDVVAVEPDRAGGRRVEAGHQPHQAGLARQRRAEQHVERAVLKRQRHVADMIRAGHRLRYVSQFEHSRLLPGLPLPSAHILLGAALCTPGFSPFMYSSSAAASSRVSLRPRLVRRHSTSSAVTRPFVIDQVAHLRLVEVGAEIPAEIGLRFGEAEQRLGARAVEPDQAARDGRDRGRDSRPSASRPARRSRCAKKSPPGSGASAVHDLPFLPRKSSIFSSMGSASRR